MTSILDEHIGFDRQPPQDLVAEQSVLGGMLLSKDAIADVVDMLAGDDFYKPAHQTIYDCVLDLYGRGEPADPITVSAELERRGELVRVGGAPYLHTLIATVPTAANASYYAEIVAEKAVLRQVIEAGTRVVQLGYNGANGADVDEVVDRVQAAVEEIVKHHRGQSRHRGTTDLVFRKLADVAAEVDARPPRPWLFEPVWVAGDYGVMSAADKAGKTWAILDAAVSCAAGLPWLDQFPCQSAGPVVVFLGEGSDAKMLRRIRAIGVHKGLTRKEVDALPILLCFRAPQLGSTKHLAVISNVLEREQPAFVIVDPLYLAAGGANGADLYAMGALLGNIQAVAQTYGTSLLIAHHWNKTGEGNGHNRSSGVGPGAWGRVLISVGVLSSHTDDTTQETTVRLEWAFKGDEIPETTMTLVRRVRAEDPTDLNSPLHYEIRRTDDATTAAASGPDELAGLRPAARRVVLVLRASSQALAVDEIGDRLAHDPTGLPLKRRTIQDALNTLSQPSHGLARQDGTRGFAQLWIATTPEEPSCL